MLIGLFFSFNAILQTKLVPYVYIVNINLRQAQRRLKAAASCGGTPGPCLCCILTRQKYALRCFFPKGCTNISYPNHSSVLFHSMARINGYRRTIIGNLNKLPGLNHMKGYNHIPGTMVLLLVALYYENWSREMNW